MTTVVSEPVLVPQQLAPRRVAWRLVVAGAISAVLAAVVYLLLVRTHIGQRFDNAAYAGSRQAGTATRAADATALQQITADSFAVVLVIIAVLGIVRRRWRLGLAAAGSAAVAVVGTDLLKQHVLTRPYLVRSDALWPHNTFPSGHTATAIACAFALVVVVPPAWRGIAAVVAGSYGWITAARVQTAGWHRPSDAIGAALVAFTAVTVVTALVAARRPVVRIAARSHVLSIAALSVVWLIAAAFTVKQLVRVLRFLVNQPDALSFTQAIQGDAYRISVNLTVVAVVSLLIALLAIVGRYDFDAPRDAPLLDEADAASDHQDRQK